MKKNVDSLRSALDLLRTMPGQLLETNTAVNTEAELAGIYRYVGAGGTVSRPKMCIRDRYVSALIKTFPVWILGTNKISAEPATELLIFLCLAASAETMCIRDRVITGARKSPSSNT